MQYPAKVSTTSAHMSHIPHRTMRTLVLSTCIILAAASLAAQSATPTASPQAPASGGNKTITGVPRYRVGIRGPRGTTANATPARVSTVGSDTTADSAALGIAPMRNNTLGIAVGTPIVVHLNQAVDSGHVQNGQILRGTLVHAVGDAAAGSPVELTVVSTAAAGQMFSAGELSVQVTRINGSTALSQIITAQGKIGGRATADSIPERGTEAQITPDQQLTLPAA